MRSRLITLLLALLVSGLSLNTSERAQSPIESKPTAPQEERPKLKDFGSSLDRLKWDPEKLSAVDKKRRAKPGEADDDDVIRVETNLVLCEVQVRDERGKTVTGLTKDDFIVTEDNQPQQIQHFSLGNDLTVGRTIVLIIDYSTSMAPYIKTSVEAAKMLVDQLGPKDTMAIVTDDVDLLVDFTRDKDKLRKGLDALNRKVKFLQVGRSRQFSALMATVREMFTPEDIRRIIIFQTDGDEVEVLRPTYVPIDPSTFRGDRLLDRNLRREFALRPFSLKDVYQAVEKSRASVYTVIPGPPIVEDLDEKVVKITDHRLLRHLRWHKAAAGAAIGGWAIYLPKPAEATAIYSKILADINSRYVIGYYPTNKVHDGKRRQVLVEVRDRPEYSITGRKTYFAPEP